MDTYPYRKVEIVENGKSIWSAEGSITVDQAFGLAYAARVICNLKNNDYVTYQPQIETQDREVFDIDDLFFETVFRDGIVANGINERTVHKYSQRNLSKDYGAIAVSYNVPGQWAMVQFSFPLEFYRGFELPCEYFMIDRKRLLGDIVDGRQNYVKPMRRETSLTAGDEYAGEFAELNIYNPQQDYELSQEVDPDDANDADDLEDFERMANQADDGTTFGQEGVEVESE